MTKTMTFIDHLEELRKRILWVFILWATFFLPLAYFSKNLFLWLQQPLLPYLTDSSTFIATSASSGWIVFLKTAFMASLALILPVFLIQILVFVAPGLKRTEKSAVFFLSLLLLTFFYAGMAFCYFVVLPYSFSFLIDIYKNTSVVFMPQITEYLSFVSLFILSFGLMFDMPFVILLLTAFNLISRVQLKKFRPYFYVLAFIIAAILTPPDYISQSLMAVPLILLFEFGMFLGFIFLKKHQKPI